MATRYYISNFHIAIFFVFFGGTALSNSVYGASDVSTFYAAVFFSPYIITLSLLIALRAGSSIPPPPTPGRYRPRRFTVAVLLLITAALCLTQVNWSFSHADLMIHKHYKGGVVLNELFVSVALIGFSIAMHAHQRIASLLFLLLFTLPLVSFGSKGAMIISAIVLGYTYVSAYQKPMPKLAILIASGIGAVTLPILLVIRYAHSSTALSLSEIIHSLTNRFYALNVFSQAVTTKSPNPFNLTYVFNNLFLSIIPRALWPGKPFLTYKLIAGHFIKTVSGGFDISIITEVYLFSGLLGILAFTIVFIYLNLLSARCFFPTTRFRVAYQSLGVYLLFQMFDIGLAQISTRYLFYIVVTYCVSLAALKRGSNGKRNSNLHNAAKRREVDISYSLHIPSPT